MRRLAKIFPALKPAVEARIKTAQVDMTEEDFKFLMENLNFHHINCAENMVHLEKFNIPSREEFALRSKSLVVYMPEEAVVIKKAEETAALKAAPAGYGLEALNGINVGCGDRRISEHLTPVDIMRSGDQTATGSHHAFLKDAILANPEDLPFKEASLDYIVALHMLEHVANPMEILKYWGSLLKPGGGIGLILPNYEYAWDARGDHSQFGHKWNTNAEIFRRLFDAHLKDDFLLEQIGTLSYKISFDVVLRKPGAFQPFQISTTTSPHSGAELARLGLMVGEIPAEAEG
ncbi:class I SAM-dependent methyltransferase [Roseibium litorale]|uniref:Methyltransferase domain-containing protein n=1 Tax=Roseibium litorale TaxID=2803841 RepID=A0ABR9CU71_9HYPH|nr:methyltransferase domain-containing protein [Roseibium litorale]MBD8894268.1 methyltransferase domain-containing protein [Roseibium litorale]